MASDTTGHHTAPDQPGTPVAGANIAMLRKAVGLTQDQLAQRANVSKSLLSKVEVGDRPASHALVAAVARALRVPIERIHGQPYEAVEAAATHAPIDELRAVLRAYDLPPGAHDMVRPLEDLRADVEAISDLCRRSATWVASGAPRAAPSA